MKRSTVDDAPEPDTLQRLRERIAEQMARADKAEAELALRRKSGSAVDRLHNLVEGISKDADGSEWSREEWERIDAETVRLQNENRELREKYDSLLLLVGKKYPGETRHETVARYIRQAEANTSSPDGGASQHD